MKCITCHEHGLIAAMQELLVCDMICWKVDPPLIIARGQTPELNAIEAPEWCPRLQVSPDNNDNPRNVKGPL